jgi:PII-like signaling protein
VNQDCLKLTSYFAEHDKAGRRFLADALLDCYGRYRLAISVLLRGTEGFGSRQHLQTQRLLTLSEDLPMVAVAVDTRERVERALTEVRTLAIHGLVTLERARLLTGEVGEVRLPQGLAEATKLTVYLGRSERGSGRPAFLAVVDLLRRHGVDGATVLLGVDGTCTASGSGPGSSGTTPRCR